MHRRILTTLLLTGLLSLSPLSTYAQTNEPAAPVPTAESASWWVALVGSVAGLLVYAGKRYVDRQLAEQVAQQERERNDHSLRIESLRREANQDKANADQIAALATSIQAMATSINSAYQSLADDRSTAAAERKEFRVVLDNNTEQLRFHTTELSSVKGSIREVSAQTSEILAALKRIDTQIGTPPDERTIVQILTETVTDVQEALQRVDEARNAISAVKPTDR